MTAPGGTPRTDRVREMHVAGLRDARMLVVGASSGIGRAVAATAIASGARVVAAARREAMLEELVAEAGGGVGVPTDITDPPQCGALAERCAAELGSIDVVVNATGISSLQRISETTADVWANVLMTNVVAGNELIRALLPHLSPDAIVAMLSSEAVTRPRAGLGAYTASKAALESSLAAWRHEHPPFRFSCVAVGATMPTEVSNDFDPGLLDEMLHDWIGTGMMQTAVMPTEDLARSLLGILASVLPFPGVGVEHVTLRSPSAVVGSHAATVTGS